MIKLKAKITLKTCFFLLAVTMGLSFCQMVFASETKPADTANSGLELQVPIFGYTNAKNIAEYILKLFNYSLYIVVPLSVVVIMYGGFLWIFAGANPQIAKTAKGYITSAVIGVVLFSGSYLILSLIGITELNVPQLTNIAGQEIPQFELKQLEIDLSDTSTESLGNYSGSFGANPYKAICDEYHGVYNTTVALKCKALGTSVPAGMTIVPMGSYGAYGGTMASTEGLAAFKKSADCVKAKFGKTVTASGWRSAAAQYQTKIDKGNYAAKPCCSNHGSGAAFDVRINGSTVRDWGTSDTYLKDCFAQNGLYAKLRGGSISEPWHFSPTGH